MKKNLFNPAILTVCFIFLMTIASELSGKWKGSFQTPDGMEVQATFTFKVDGDKFTGTAESSGNEALIMENGKISGPDFSFTLNIGGAEFMHKGKIYGDSCGLDIDFGGTNVHTTLTRIKD